MKIKSITNIATIGELKKFLNGIPDDIKIVMNDGEICYSEPISLEYFPHLRKFEVGLYVSEDSRYFKRNCFDVEI